MNLNWAELLSTAEQAVVKLAKENPVIIFGMPVNDKLKKLLPLGTYTAHLATDEQVKTAVIASASKLLGVISYNPKYIVGAGFRFVTEATVVIVCRELPDRETIN